MKGKIIIAFLAITLAACAQTSTANVQSTAVAIVQTDVVLTQTAMPTATPTNTPTALPTSTTTPTLIPTQLPVPLLTPDTIQVEKWKEYQAELAKAVLSSNFELGNDPAVYEDALCEWDILGQSNQEIYVYAKCASAKGNGGARSPAIIYLELDGSIRSVRIAEFKGSFYDLGLYPVDVQQKFCYYFPFPPPDRPPCFIGSMNPEARVDVLYAHLEYRKTHPEEPPLVVLSVTSTSTLTPIP